MIDDINTSTKLNIEQIKKQYQERKYSNLNHIHTQASNSMAIFGIVPNSQDLNMTKKIEKSEFRPKFEPLQSVL